MKKFIGNEGSFVRDLLLALPKDEMACVVMNLAALFINAFEGSSDIVAERDSRNQSEGTAETRLPPVVPQHLIKTCNT